MNIADIKQFAQRFKKRTPTDVVGLDVGATSVKAVRIRKTEIGTTLLGADVLPAVKTMDEASGARVQPPPVVLPAKLKARVVALSVSGARAVIKLLNLPGHFDAAAEERLVDSMGLEKPEEYRIGYKLIVEGSAKGESRVLTVALPDADAQVIPRLFPSGLPAPYSLEVSEVAAMTAFLHSAGVAHEKSTVALIDFGTSTTSFSVFNKNLLALTRRFQMGSHSLLGKVQEMLGVDMETARGIINDGAFDISQAATEVLGPFMKQLVVSRDFIERRENCHVDKVYVGGGLACSRDAMAELKSALGVEISVWNPLEGLTLAPGAVPESLAGQEWRLSAALGAAMATCEGEG